MSSHPAGPGLRRVGYLLAAAGLAALLVAAYRLWGTNLIASRSQTATVQKLRQGWLAQRHRTDPARAADPAPGTPFAIVSIPRLQELGRPHVFPVVEGDGPAELDRGAVGHHPTTAMPGQGGNLVLAGHRNGHGEPFRNLDRLRVGDRVIVTTAAGGHTYVLDRQLARAGPSDVEAMAPVPPEMGVSRPGRYITLITCAPAFSTRYRMIWWGHLVEAAHGAEGQ